MTYPSEPYLCPITGVMMVDEGEDQDGYVIAREATTDELHDIWIAERDGFDASAQAADDLASERSQ